MNWSIYLIIYLLITVGSFGFGVYKLINRHFIYGGVCIGICSILCIIAWLFLNNIHIQ